MKGKFRQVAGPGISGRRLDVWAASYLEVSRKRARNLIESGDLKLNGAVAKPSRLIRPGDVLEGAVPDQPLAKLEAEPGTVPVVFQDDHVLVVDKPAGIAVHPGAGRRKGTLVNVLLGMGISLAPAAGKVRPGMVHRLDRDTSGLMVLAKTDEAYWGLVPQVARREMKREYRAIVAGIPNPKRGTINAALGRDPRKHDQFVVVSAGGRKAVTHYELIEVVGRASMVKVTLETGRTHQIRVHFAACGWPVLGDRAYSRSRVGDQGIGRQALHAAKLSFAHPVSGLPMNFSSPLPADMQELLDRLRKSE